ncbi:MAG: beta-N-acetylhexosaminidase [Bacteroidales bacterium]|nr:beta-N-acetylhexosaminidase [Bacteroidales bacterium]
MIKKVFLLGFLLVLATLNLSAQLKLIPSPQKLELKEGFFTLNSKTKLKANHVDAFYANQLTEVINNKFGIEIEIAKKKRENAIVFIKTDDSLELTKILSSNNLDKSFTFGAEGYILQITTDKIQIISQTDAGLFYGIQTLKQLIKSNSKGNKIPYLTIYDYPDIAVRAWQDDISRGPIPTLEMMKTQIKTLASFKLNHFSLYIEHVFQLDKHPGIAPEDGISEAEIEELTAFAAQYHVKLIGSYQSFGHMEETLIHPDYQHLAENEHIISPALSESYEFLSDVYSEIVPAFSGKYFNINCDETFGLGRGKSKAMVDSMGVEGVYLYHINKLNKLLIPYDKQILMWGDIVGNHPEIIPQLPKDITVMAWAYHAADSFDNVIVPLAQSGLDFWVAPGVNCWSNIFPNMREAEINIYNLIRDGYKHNTKGVFNTSWDDDGLNFFHNNWHGFVWGAENSWKVPEVDADQSNETRIARYRTFNQAFDAIFYGLENVSLITEIISFAALHQNGVRDILKNSRFFEPIFPIHLEYVQSGKRIENLNLLSKMQDLLTHIEAISPEVTSNNASLDYLKFAIQQVQFTLQKNIFRIDLYHFIQNDNSITELEIKAKISKLVEQAKTLKETYTVLWLNENRPYWLDVNEQKFDKLIADIANLEAYCLIIPAEQLSEKGREISLKSLFGDLPVFYTTGQDTAESLFQPYTENLFFDKDVSIKARVIEDGKAYNISEMELINHKAIGKLHKLNSTYSDYHPSYDGGGQLALLDGQQGEAADLWSGKWQGFTGQNIDIEIDLDSVQALNYFSMGFYQNTEIWVIFPRMVEIYTKTNSKDDYKLIETIVNIISPETEGSHKQNLEATFDQFEARYMKVVAHYFGRLPEWHPAGSQYESMIFSDEIILR